MFLEYGVNAHGQIMHISQAARGRVDLTCPYCGAGLLARKGQQLQHHFAHDGETCRAAGRDFERLDVPGWARFNLHLSAQQWSALQDFHSSQIFSHHLLNANLISEKWGRYGGYELTLSGKIPFGLATLSAFADFQDGLIFSRHADLSETFANAQWGVNFGSRLVHPPRPDEAAAALVDLNIYRAQLRRLCSQQLYLLEIKHSGGVLFKIGITSRTITERINEVRRVIAPHIDLKGITPLRLLAGRGTIEQYALYRYRDYAVPLAGFKEYFAFDAATRRKVLADFTRLEDRQLPGIDARYRGSDADRQYSRAGLLAEIIDGYPSLIEQVLLTEQRQQQHIAATRAGMKRAKLAGRHVGRPSGTAEEASAFLAKYPAVIEALLSGLSLRQTAQATGVAVNTVRKVKHLLH